MPTPGRQHDDRRIGLAGRRQRPQRGEQRLAVVRDRPHVVAVEQVREDALGHLAIGEHVGDAARHAQVVLEDDEAAVLEADQVGAGNRDVDVAMDAHAAHLAAVVAAAVDELARHDAFGEDAPLVVDVAQEQVDRGQPLGQAALERGPLAGR